MKAIKLFIASAIAFVSLFTSLTMYAQVKAGRKDTTQHLTLQYYTCPMHPDVSSDKAGKCTKCGMDLVITKKEQLKREVTRNYVCPVHLDVVSHDPGKCPKCGKKLNLSPKEQMKAEVTKLYTCPMHPEVALDKEGKCPKCGKDLIEKNQNK